MIRSSLIRLSPLALLLSVSCGSLVGNEGLQETQVREAVHLSKDAAWTEASSSTSRFDLLVVDGDPAGAREALFGVSRKVPLASVLGDEDLIVDEHPVAVREAGFSKLTPRGNPALPLEAENLLVDERPVEARSR